MLLSYIYSRISTLSCSLTTMYICVQLTSAFPLQLLSPYLCSPLTSAFPLSLPLLCFHQEIGRLQKLPGYPRLKKQLIVNLMTAPPDITHKNIRVYVYLILYQFIQCIYATSYTYHHLPHAYVPYVCTHNLCLFILSIHA